MTLLHQADKLTASIDESGGVVLHNASGDISLYVADGKMKVVRRGQECDECTGENLKFARQLARLWNARNAEPLVPAKKRKVCNL